MKQWAQSKKWRRFHLLSSLVAMAARRASMSCRMTKCRPVIWSNSPPVCSACRFLQRAVTEPPPCFERRWVGGSRISQLAATLLGSPVFTTEQETRPSATSCGGLLPRGENDALLFHETRLLGRTARLTFFSLSCAQPAFFSPFFFKSVNPTVDPTISWNLWYDLFIIFSHRQSLPPLILSQLPIWDHGWVLYVDVNWFTLKRKTKAQSPKK